MSERIKSTLLALSNCETFGSVPGLVHNQRIEARLTERALNDFTHHRRIVDDQGFVLRSFLTPVLLVLSAQMRSS